jgi:raffinose/stachyose/melibiose transport system permease protein
MKIYKRYTPYIYILPCVLLVLIFIYIPIVETFYFSFFKLSAYSKNISFVRLANYSNLLKDKIFFTALKNNAMFTLISVLIQVGGGLIIALLLESKSTGRIGSTFRNIYFIPSLIAVSAVAILWTFIYEPDVGLLNNLLRTIGLGNLQKAWLGESKTAMLSIIAMSQWQYTGYSVLLLVVAIQKVPDQLMEAASIDGANGIQRAVLVMIPLIKEMILVTVILSMTGCFKVFAEVYATTSGGPGYITEVLGTYLYKNAFYFDKMGYGSAIAFVVFLITFSTSVLQLRISHSAKE